MSVRSSSRASPVPARQPSIRPGWYWIIFRAVPDDLEQVGEAGDREVGQHAALEHGPDRFSRFAIVHATLGRRLLARRLSAGGACFGWLSGLSGCGHVIRGDRGRRGRCERGHSPWMTVLPRVSEGELWTSFPEATRSDVLGLLGVLLERWAVSAGLAAEGAGGEHGAAG
jgi:hypothetical protein